MQLLVTNDTGTMHLAASLGVPTVALFGSTEPTLTRPLGRTTPSSATRSSAARATSANARSYFRCMQAITPEEVVEAVLDLVRRRPPTLGLGIRFRHVGIGSFLSPPREIPPTAPPGE